MKRILQIIILLLIAFGSLSAQSPKRDVRAVWITTAWGQSMDWPSVTVPATGTETQREKARETQKTGLDNILNTLQMANFNTVYFQVRGMCDAFYKSKYEPWSQYISSTRGADPGWDPLEYAVTEAHARGMELHAWINPYRYSSAGDSHGNLDSDYAKTNPDWLLDYGSSKKILNPGISDVRKRICDVVEDIITNYNVDGIVFDDYFYMSGTTNAMDQKQFDAYNPSNLSRGDWRRENVNQMVRDVQTRINSKKPYLTFGISPAGVAASDATVAAKYGVDRCPSGTDWQYNSIYSSPLAWITENTIDYISPQIYWSTTSTNNNYRLISAWWAKVTNQFGRHFFSSNTSHIDTNNRFLTSEMLSQLRLLRDADLNGIAGAVHFRYASYLVSTFYAFKEDLYQFPALTAIYAWKPAPMQSLVENLAVSGQNLTWTYTDNNVRYAVYAIPNANRNDADVFTTSKYLLGVAYSKTYTLPTKINTSTHKIAVAVYDRYGNLFSPRVWSEGTTTLVPAQLIYPANNQADMIIPAFFSWNNNGADYYVWQLAEDAAFTKPIASRETKNPNFNSALQSNIKANTTYYWRVKSIKANAPVTVSEVRAFNATKPANVRITAPANGASNVSLTPSVTWINILTGATYTLEISTQLSFDDIVYTTTGQITSATVPSGRLNLSTTYYVRVKAELGTKQYISEQTYFSTAFVSPEPMPVPTIISPTNGATIHGMDINITWKEQRSRGFEVQVSQNSAFPTRETTSKRYEDPFIYSHVFNNLKKGTWYIRMKALLDDNKETSTTETITVYLDGEAAIPNVEASKFWYNYCDAAGNCHIVIDNSDSPSATVDIYSIAGILLNKQTFSLNAEKTISLDMTGYAKGLYLIKVKAGSIEQTMKVRK